MILFWRWLIIIRIIAAVKQKSVACIDPSGPNVPPVISVGPWIFVFSKLFPIEFPEVTAPKTPDCVKFHAKCIAIGNHKFLL